MKFSIFFRAIVLLLMLTQVGGCAGRRAFQDGEDLLRQGDYDAAVVKYFEAVEKNPESYEFRMRLQNARSQASREHTAAGRRLVAQAEYRAALGEFQQGAALDPTNETARQETKKVQGLLEAGELIDQAKQFYGARKFLQAKNALDEALALHPGNPRAHDLLAKVKGEQQTVLDGIELNVASSKPITLKFKDTDLRDVFNIVSKLSGINFIFDEDIRAQRMSILLENATFAQALELLLRLNNLERKVLNAKTILIYPQTKEKGKKYEDHIIQTFYLSNIDAKKAVNLLRTMLQLRKIYVHEELNALVVRDTPATVRLAQQIIEAADRSDSEVIYELELIEVEHADGLDIGARLSPYSTSFGFVNPGPATAAGSTTTGTPATKIESPVTSSFSSLNFLYTVPTASFSFQKTLLNSEILANPKIRVKNKEKAKVHIGSREPIVTNTLTAGGDVTSTNVQYVDVGVKLDIEPNIQLDNTVVTKISLEVSDGTRKTFGSTEALTITTTSAQTALILRDGEQTIIGGLIRDKVTKSKDSIPLLGDLPLFGNLFSGHKRDKTKREILLSITPHIVKNLSMPRAEVSTIWSGGEDDLQTSPRFGAFATILEAEAEQPRPPSVPARSPARERGWPAAGKAAEELATASPADESAPPAIVSAPPAPGQPQIFLAGGGETRVGEEFVMEVRVRGVEKLHSAPLFVTYEPTVLEFVRAEEGDFLRSAGGSTVFSTGNVNIGELIVGHKQEAGGTGASGEGMLFRLVFRGVAPGPGRVALERINFRDPSGQRLDLAGVETVLDVRQP